MNDAVEHSPVPTDPGLATAPLSVPAPRGRHVALVPGEQVPLIALDLPPGLRGVAREKVAQRQIADLLGSGAGVVQMRPFALGGDTEGWTHVMLTEAAQLSDWTRQAGRRCVAVLPDYLALPVEEDGWTVSGADGRVRARFGPMDGVTTNEAALILQAARILAEGAAPKRVLRFGAPLPVFEAWLAERGIPLVGDPGKKDTTSAKAFSRGETALDLRADPQAARGRLRRQVNAWRWPVLISAVAAGLWAAAQLTVIRAVEQEVAALNARVMDRTRANLVPAGPILDIRVQVARALAEQRSALRASGGKVSPLDLFGDAAPVLSGAGAALQSVDWSPAEGLRLGVILSDFAAVDALVDALIAEGLNVTVRDARLAAEGGGVVADLVVEQPEQDG